jgi:hypothetical protein
VKTSIYVHALLIIQKHEKKRTNEQDTAAYDEDTAAAPHDDD